MESNTSDIDNLPNELKPAENVKMSVSEASVSNNVITELSKESISQIVNGLQEAGASQLTGLPSKHIPNQNSQVSFDPNVKVNHIPSVEESKMNYIEDDNTFEEIVEKSRQKENNDARLEQIYDEFQTPILGMVLYFLLQLPYIQKIFIRNFPSLFNKDGFHTLSGYMVQTVLFGVGFYGLNTLSNHLSVL
jgi:hypothetical protein|tara:strand:+ start:56 stop:628 length:573 start_codon:yes stop_codon:yes gene_type:complete